MLFQRSPFSSTTDVSGTFEMDSGHQLVELGAKSSAEASLLDQQGVPYGGEVSPPINRRAGANWRGIWVLSGGRLQRHLPGFFLS